MRALGFDVDAELLTFLVEVAPLETERPCGLGNVVPVGLELRQDNLTLESRHTIGEWTTEFAGTAGAAVTSGKNLPCSRAIHDIISQQ